MRIAAESDYDSKARPSLRSVGQVAKQKCCNQTSDCRGIRERDETSIDERDHHRHHQVEAGATKGKRRRASSGTLMTQLRAPRTTAGL